MLTSLPTSNSGRCRPIFWILQVCPARRSCVSKLLGTELVQNEFAAYIELQQLMASSDTLLKRGFTVASYALCGFANIGTLAIAIGLLSALAPSQSRLIAQIGPSAVICGFISTLQAAGIAWVVISTIPSPCRFMNADDVTLLPFLLAICSGMLV